MTCDVNALRQWGQFLSCMEDIARLADRAG